MILHCPAVKSCGSNASPSRLTVLIERGCLSSTVVLVLMVLMAAFLKTSEMSLMSNKSLVPLAATRRVPAACQLPFACVAMLLLSLSCSGSKDNGRSGVRYLEMMCSQPTGRPSCPLYSSQAHHPLLNDDTELSFQDSSNQLDAASCSQASLARASCTRFASPAHGTASLSQCART